MNSICSIYIPRMSTKHNEESVRRTLAVFRVGVVSHVDFTPIDKKPGFGENVDSVVKSAFVHFSETNTDISYGPIFDYNYEFWHIIATQNPAKIQVSKNEYWICLKNNNPVKRTMMNIHQVVENGRHLENLIEEQSQTIKELSEKLDSVHHVVYQLLGGLFNQKTQEGILDAHLKILFDSSYSSCEELKDTSKWSIWPTTRQGDDCEKRIEELEKMLGVDNEEQDSKLLARKHRCACCDDDSTIESDMIEDDERIEMDRILREEELYYERQERAREDWVADRGRW